LTKAVPRWWSFRSCPMVFSHPKTSSTRFRYRWLIA
jgi:hypothetical protein